MWRWLCTISFRGGISARKLHELCYNRHQLVNMIKTRKNVPRKLGNAYIRVKRLNQFSDQKVDIDPVHFRMDKFTSSDDPDELTAWIAGQLTL